MSSRRRRCSAYVAVECGKIEFESKPETDMDRTLTRNDYLSYLTDAANSGTLLTGKHNPNNIGTTWNKDRSVTVKPPAELTNYIASGDFDIRAYENQDARHPPCYLELIPSDASVVTGSGIPAYSTTPTYSCDRFVAVSGVRLGWHIFAELSTTIQARTASGVLRLIADFSLSPPSSP